MHCSLCSTTSCDFRPRPARSSKHASLSLLRLFSLPLALGATILAAAPPKPILPLQAELVGPLETTRVHVGDSVLLRVARSWVDGGCALSPGSIVQGHVVAFLQRTKGLPDSQLQVAFTSADCGGHPETPFSFTLAAMVLTPSVTDSGLAEATPLADVPGLGIGGGGGGLRSVSTAINSTTYSGARRGTPPASVLPGQVLGLRKVALRLGAGVDGTTIIVGAGSHLHLPPLTTFILLPKSFDAAPAATPTIPGAASPTAPATAVRQSAAASTLAINSPQAVSDSPVDEMELCSGICDQISPAALRPDAQPTAPVAVLRIDRFGYAPRLVREIASFDSETTLTYLDDTHLLCTFDPHHLRSRTTFFGESSRTIDVLLIDTKTYSIKRSLQWRVSGDNQYLWRLSGGRVLVHIGRELRLLDTDLKTIKTYKVDKPVAWVDSSPDSEHIVVALLEERHSEATHQGLSDTLGVEPEEDLNVVVLDGSLQPMLMTRRTTASPMPVLSNAGELRLKGLGKNRWKLSEYRWDRSERDIVSTDSTCRPQLTTLEQGLIFAVGCTSTGGRWYRMLRADGHPLLKANSSSMEMAHWAQASTGAFAIRVVSSTKPMNYGQPFRRAALDKEQISIYNSENGSHLATISSSDFNLSQFGFALAPNTRQVALAGNESILFFAPQR